MSYANVRTYDGNYSIKMSSAAYAKDSQYCLYIAKFLRTQEGRGLCWRVHVWRVGVGHFAKGSPAWQIRTPTIDC